MQKTIDSFRYAFRGINDALKSEPNLRFHLLVSAFVLLLALILKFEIDQYVLLLLTIIAVISLELVNTVVEKIVDLHSLEKSESARVIKDISAGIVLIASIGAVIIGVLLFYPKLFI